MAQRRIPKPQTRECATDFDSLAELGDPVFLIKLLKSQRNVWPALKDAEGRLASRYGPEREKGSYVLAYVGYLISTCPDLKKWHKLMRSHTPFWRACGFSRVPAYPTTWERFAELESMRLDVVKKAYALIHQAMAQDENIGVHLHVDATESEAHTEMLHACGDDCPLWDSYYSRGDTKWVRERRQRETSIERDETAAQPDGDDEDGEAPVEEVGAADEPTTDATATAPDAAADEDDEDEYEERRETAAAIRRSEAKAWAKRRKKKTRARIAELMEHVVDQVEITADIERETGLPVPGRVFKLIRSGGRRPVFKLVRPEHTWLTLDGTAGLRWYQDEKKFWPGYTSEKAICHYTKAPICALTHGASTNESTFFTEKFLDEMLSVLTDPVTGEQRLKTITADRGLGVKEVFQMAAERGVAVVIPLPRPPGKRYHPDTDKFDRDGVLRCPSCGGVTRFVRPVPGSNPKVEFECANPVDENCTPSEGWSISCSEDPRFVLFLWKGDEVYQELQATHSEYEAVHDYWRDRYLVGGSGLGQRPKRVGLPAAQFREAMALLIDWLRLSYLNGWLPLNRQDRRRKLTPLEVADRANLSVRLRKKKLVWQERRRRAGLHLPYGTAAVQRFGDAFLVPRPQPRPRPPGRAPAAAAAAA